MHPNADPSQPHRSRPVLRPDAHEARAPRTAAERERLAIRTQAHLAEARTACPERARALRSMVVTDHLWLATSLARRYRGRGLEDDDLVQVARGGLVEAALRHDPAHGSYGPYATSTVCGVLKRHFRDHAWSVRPPRETQELAGQLWKVWPELAQVGGRTPSDADLATRLDASVGEVRQARFATQGYATGTLDELSLVADGWSSAVGTDGVERRLLLAAALRRLTEAERCLLAWRFVEQRSQREIAERLGVGQMQVSRRLARLLTRLRGLIGPLDAG